MHDKDTQRHLHTRRPLPPRRRPRPGTATAVVSRPRPERPTLSALPRDHAAPLRGRLSCRHTHGLEDVWSARHPGTIAAEPELAQPLPSQILPATEVPATGVTAATVTPTAGVETAPTRRRLRIGRIALAAAAVVAAVAVVLGITARGAGSAGSVVLAVVVVWLGGNALIIAGIIAAEITRAHRSEIDRTADRPEADMTAPSADAAAHTAHAESGAPRRGRDIAPAEDRPGTARH